MQDNALRLAAALAYYTMFSLAPLLVVTISVCGLVFGEEAVRGELSQQIESVVGKPAAEAIQSMVQSASNHGASIMGTIIGLAILLFGAAGVFGQLKDALNTIWEVRPKPGLGVAGFIRKQLLSFTMVLGAGFLLLVSLVLSTAVTAFSDYISYFVPGIPPATWQLINFLLFFVISTFLFAMMFKFLPDACIQWKDVWIGAAVTALLFNVGKHLLGLYLARESLASGYGAAGAVIVILLWIYYASVILFVGAEFTQVYARATGSQIRPDEHAEAIPTEKRLQEGLAIKHG